MTLLFGLVYAKVFTARVSFSILYVTLIAGVVGAIVSWNFPLTLLAWKVCPALAMGNTVVFKPASNTSLSALLFAEICAEAG